MAARVDYSYLAAKTNRELFIMPTTATASPAGAHIVLVTDAWLPQTNGVVRTLGITVDELQQLGHTVTPITPQDFNTIPCPTYPEIRLAVLPGRKLAKQLSNLTFDHIHIATEGPIGMAARRWCLKNGVPFSTAFHTRFPEYISTRTGIPARWGYIMMRRFHAPAKSVMVPTQTMIDTLVEHGFENAKLWARGVHLDKFKPAATRPTVLDDLPRPIAICTGRVSVEKNLEAFLGMDWPGSKVIVGDGPQRAELEKKYPNVRFTGKLSDADMIAHLQAADVFVFPSLTETFGNVVLEALACGLPVAAYPITGPKDILGLAPVPNKVGALDADLATAAQAAVKDADRAACRAHAESFRWPVVTQQFLSHLAPANKTNK